MSNPSSNASKTVKVTRQLPNKRERASAQFGQLSDIVSASWAGSPPNTIGEAINRMAALLKVLNSNTPIP